MSTILKKRLIASAVVTIAIGSIIAGKYVIDKRQTKNASKPDTQKERKNAQETNVEYHSRPKATGIYTLYKPMQTWKYVATHDGDHIHFNTAIPPSPRDHKLVVRLPYLKQHEQYQAILQAHKLCRIPSNKPEDEDVITFMDVVEGEPIGDNILIRKATKLIALDMRMRNGEKLKPSDWTTPTKESLHDSKVNSIFYKIPK